MKVRQFLLSVALPLFLASLILALGTLIPSAMLRRQAQGYTREVSQVEIGDVRPYGDSYEETKKNLLNAIHVLDNAHYMDEERSQQMAEKSGRTVTELYAFLENWNLKLAEEGWVLDVLINGLTVDAITWLEDESGDHQVFHAESYELKSGRRSYFTQDPVTGTPLSINLNLSLAQGDIDPQSLSNSLLKAYYEHSGLLFSQLYVDYMTLDDGQSIDANLDSFQKAAELGQMPQAHFIALSSDLTFYLELYVDRWDDSWDICAKLCENTERLPEGPEENVADISGVFDNSVTTG